MRICVERSPKIDPGVKCECPDVLAGAKWCPVERTRKWQ